MGQEVSVVRVEVAPAGRSQVGGGLGGERLDAAGVTVLAEDVSVQRVAALVVALRQQGAAVLRDRVRLNSGFVHEAPPTLLARRSV